MLSCVSYLSWFLFSFPELVLAVLSLRKLLLRNQLGMLDEVRFL